MCLYKVDKFVEFSVVIPTYNRGYCILNAIESVLSQTFKDYEIIVIDDGSTDDTRSILAPFVDKKIIRYFYQENKGASTARNTGIKLSRGEWVAFLDSDDLWLPDKLKRHIDIIRRSNIDIGCVITNVIYNPPLKKRSNNFQDAPFVPDNDCGICHNINLILLTRFILFNQGSIIKKKILESIGGYNDKLKILEDYDISLKISFLCKWGYDTYPNTIYNRETENSLSSNIEEKVIYDQLHDILSQLEIFLLSKNIDPPKIIKKRIFYYKLKSKCLSINVLKYLFKLYDFLYSRSIFFPKPKTSSLKL